jgi:hypothetical protein
MGCGAWFCVVAFSVGDGGGRRITGLVEALSMIDMDGGSSAVCTGSSTCLGASAGGMSPNCIVRSSWGVGRSLGGTAPDILLLDILLVGDAVSACIGFE